MQEHPSSSHIFFFSQPFFMSAAVELAEGHRFTKAWFLIPLVILCYDHLLTLESEITFVWRRPKRLSFLLFSLLRYFSLLSNIGRIILNFGNLPIEALRADTGCHAWDIGKIVLIIIQCILVGNILGLRVYAKYSFSKTVLCILIITGLTTSTLAVWSATGQTWILATEVTGMATAWESQFFCDVAIFGFTIMRSFRQPFKVAGSILSRMARDDKSTTPYSVLALVNFGNIWMYYVGSFSYSQIDSGS
ncbi:hypothetical protein FB451DRAFT_1283215 [Mycena latifolia]|nr:hypothetical protein FB451DRAFT_1283215 [Mycena latifolia]